MALVGFFCEKYVHNLILWPNKTTHSDLQKYLNISFFFWMGVRKKRKGYEDDEYVSKRPKMDEVSKSIVQVLDFLTAKIKVTQLLRQNSASVNVLLCVAQAEFFSTFFLKWIHTSLCLGVSLNTPPTPVFCGEGKEHAGDDVSCALKLFHQTMEQHQA